MYKICVYYVANIEAMLINKYLWKYLYSYTTKPLLWAYRHALGFVYISVCKFNTNIHTYSVYLPMH